MNKISLLALAVVALSGCSKSDPTSDNNPGKNQPHAEVTASLAPPDLELGRRIYNFRCYYCHGYSGNARTLAATFLNPKPRDFTSTSPDQLSRDRMQQSIQHGRPGTGMMSFASVLQPNEIAAVADFIRHEFMTNKAENTRYHTKENGWPDHERYAAAYPFALGQVALDTPWEQLSEEQAAGKRLFLTTCVSCHDRAHVSDETINWELRPVSYPRNQFSPGDDKSPPAETGSEVDGMSSASPYLLHDRAPKIDNLTPTERLGENLFQHNCAFCHAADGTARNWIGSFMEPHPRNLTDPVAMHGITRDQLRTVIREGLPNTSMPAWKSVLSEDEVQAIIAYVGRAFHTFPAQASTPDPR